MGMVAEHRRCVKPGESALNLKNRLAHLAHPARPARPRLLDCLAIDRPCELAVPEGVGATGAIARGDEISRGVDVAMGPALCGERLPSS